jgi:hypothetical protein
MANKFQLSQDAGDRELEEVQYRYVTRNFQRSPGDHSSLVPLMHIRGPRAGGFGVGSDGALSSALS